MALLHANRTFMTLSPDALRIYGEEISLHATPDTLSLSATNSAKSAYCRLKYDKQFFSRYNIARHPDLPAEHEPEVLGQLTARSMLSILKHRTVEKTVERCEFSIVDGDQQEDAGEDHDALESKLIIKLHCKHGIVKTHRILMLTPTSMLAPSMPDSALESRLTIGPRGLKYIIEHFPMPRGAKSDPSLIWSFGDVDVEVKSLESSLDPKSRGQIMTEMTISAEEFDVYDIIDMPTTISFHLREFNSTIAFAESMGLPLDLHFTDAAAPLFIDIEGDSLDALFVISTSQVPGSMANSQRAGAGTQRSNQARTNAMNPSARRQPDNGSSAGGSQPSHTPAPPSLQAPSRKRVHDGSASAPDSARGRKSMRVVQQTPTSVKHANGGMMPPPAVPPAPYARQPYETPQRARVPETPVNRGVTETPEQQTFTPLLAQRVREEAPSASQDSVGRFFQSSQSGSLEVARNDLFEVSQNQSVEYAQRQADSSSSEEVPSSQQEESMGEPLFLPGPSQYPSSQPARSPSSSARGPRQPLFLPGSSQFPVSQAARQAEDESRYTAETSGEPLFLPGPSQFASSQQPSASQITSDDPEALRQVESMTQDELDAMFDMGDIDLELKDETTLDDNVSASRRAAIAMRNTREGDDDAASTRRSSTIPSRSPSANASDHPQTPIRTYSASETQLPATQASDSGAFQPLFED